MLAANYAESCPIFGLYELAPGFLFALVVTVVFSLITKKPSDEIIAEFNKVDSEIKG